MSITVTELAAELNISLSAVARRVKLMKLPRRRLNDGPRRAWSLSDGAADRVRAFYASHRCARELEGWLTTAQTTAALGISRRTMNRRIQAGTLGLTPLREICPQAALRYDPAEVLRAASSRPVVPKAAPRGTYASADLARLLGISLSAMRKWGKQGCPVAGQTVRGRAYYRPAAVMAWLEGQPISPHHPSHRTARENLRAHLQHQERAA